MENIEILYDILTQEELNYIKGLIEDKSNWNWRTNYDDLNGNGEKLWYDSIFPDYDRLKNYHSIITQNGKYLVAETAINIISKERQNKNNYHKDSGDLSYVTYFDRNFEGGRFFYYNNQREKFVIEPQAGLSIKIGPGVFHEVEEIFDGIRYSLYSFLIHKPKEFKSII